MPQIEQLPFIYASQIFWLVVVFGILLVGIGYGMLPKIQSTVEARDARIAEDLATFSGRSAFDATPSVLPPATVIASAPDAHSAFTMSRRSWAPAMPCRLRLATRQLWSSCCA